MNNLLFPIILFSILITTFNRGFFSLPSIAILLVLYFFLLLIFYKKIPLTLKKNSKSNIFSYIFLSSYLLSLFFSGGIYQIKYLPSLLIVILPLLFLPLALTFIFPNSHFGKKERNLRYLFFLLLAFVLRLLIIIASPEPIIDVFTMLKEAPLKFISGNNPYDSMFSQVYTGVKPDYYTYWPVSFLIELPFVLIFKDPRVLLVFLSIVSSLLIAKLGNNSEHARTLSLIYLFRPNSIFIIEQSWLVPLEFFFVALIYFLWRRKKVNGYITGIILGLATGIKFYHVVIMIFIVILSYFQKGIRSVFKILFGFLTTFLLTVVSFLVWNPFQFINNTILYFFKSLENSPQIPVHRSLNLNNLFFLFTGRDLSFFLTMSLTLIIISYVIYSLINSLIKKKGKNIYSETLLAQSIVFITLFMFFRHAYINYYYFITGLIILWSAAVISKDMEPHG